MSGRKHVAPPSAFHAVFQKAKSVPPPTVPLTVNAAACESCGPTYEPGSIPIRLPNKSWNSQKLHDQGEVLQEKLKQKTTQMTKMIEDKLGMPLEDMLNQQLSAQMQSIKDGNGPVAASLANMYKSESKSAEPASVFAPFLTASDPIDTSIGNQNPFRFKTDIPQEILNDPAKWTKMVQDQSGAMYSELRSKARAQVPKQMGELVTPVAEQDKKFKEATAGHMSAIAGGKEIFQMLDQVMAPVMDMPRTDVIWSKAILEPSRRHQRVVDIQNKMISRVLAMNRNATDKDASPVSKELLPLTPWVVMKSHDDRMEMIRVGNVNKGRKGLSFTISICEVTLHFATSLGKTKYTYDATTHDSITVNEKHFTSDKINDELGLTIQPENIEWNIDEFGCVSCIGPGFCWARQWNHDAKRWNAEWNVSVKDMVNNITKKPDELDNIVIQPVCIVPRFISVTSIDGAESSVFRDLVIQAQLVFHDTMVPICIVWAGGSYTYFQLKIDSTLVPFEAMYPGAAKAEFVPLTDLGVETIFWRNRYTITRINPAGTVTTFILPNFPNFHINFVPFMAHMVDHASNIDVALHKYETDRMWVTRRDEQTDTLESWIPCGTVEDGRDTMVMRKIVPLAVSVRGSSGSDSRSVSHTHAHKPCDECLWMIPTKDFSSVILSCATNRGIQKKTGDAWSIVDTAWSDSCSQILGESPIVGFEFFKANTGIVF